MFGLTRWSPFEDVFNFQREVDRLFDQFWSDLPTRMTAGWSPSFRMSSGEDGYRIDVPLAGVDPENITLEVSGNVLTIRAEQPGDKDSGNARYEQSITVPQFIDLDKVRASHRHGLLQVELPLKESVKPRRIQIESVTGDKKQLTAAA